MGYFIPHKHARWESLAFYYLLIYGVMIYSDQNKDHGIRSHHFTANRWGNRGKNADFILGGSIITADGDCSHEIKRCLLIGRKVMTNLDNILKSRDITLTSNGKDP